MSSNSVVGELRDLGSAAHKEGDYRAALHAFDQALTQLKRCKSVESRASSMQLLDSRIEIRIKIKKYERAFKDARSMIRLTLDDAKGYIRCGQLQFLQGDRAAALKWYEQGLKHVSETDSVYHVLRTQQQITARATSFSKPTDPIAALPLEMIHIILSMFTYGEVTAVLRVSKTWRDTLGSLPILRTKLDFSSHSRKPISSSAFKACLRRLLGPPKVIITREMSTGATRELRNLLPSWIRAQHVQLEGIDLKIPCGAWSAYKSLKVLALDERQNVSQKDVFEILDNCPSLVHATFRSVRKSKLLRGTTEISQDKAKSMPKMRSLTITGIPADALVWPMACLNRCANLTDISLSDMALTTQEDVSDIDFSIFFNLRSVTMIRIAGARFPRLPHSLEKLECHGWHSQVDPWAIQSLGLDCVNPVTSSYLENLQKIHLSAMGHQPFLPLELLPPTGHPNVLRQLDLYECQLSLVRFSRLLRNGAARKVTAIRLSMPELGDDDLDLFLHHCPRLETLLLIGTKVTGVFVKGLVTVLGIQLKRLGLLGPDSKVSLDAVQWARTKGVNVEWDAPGNDLPLGGRALGIEA